MTQAELEEQVKKNTKAIQDLSNSLSNYATKSEVGSISSNLQAANSLISRLQTAVNVINSSIALINKISKLLDVNIGTDLAKDDVLAFDGDRWTNISAKSLITQLPSSVLLETLSDVSISNKQDGQALCWDNSTQKWTNKVVQGGGGSGSGLDATAMWNELGKSGTQQINPSHITGSLNLSGLNVTGDSKLASGDNYLIVSSTKNEVKGDLVGLNEITA